MFGVIRKFLAICCRRVVIPLCLLSQVTNPHHKGEATLLARTRERGVVVIYGPHLVGVV